MQRTQDDHQATSMSDRIPPKPPPRIQIEDPAPLLDCGRYRAKACVGDTVEVQATIFRDGQDILRAVVQYRGPGDRRWSEASLRRIDAHHDGDRWAGVFPVATQGRWRWTIFGPG